MKKEGLKIVTIGGGSSYTPELMEGFIIRQQELPVREIWLVDVEEGKEKMEIVAEFARRMIRKAGADIKVFTTLDRRAALPGADFVTTQFRVGQMEARIRDERIPLSHGLIGQETNGAGGMFKGLRTIPVILDIVKDIQEICPDAWLINFTNPSGMVTQAVYDKTDYRKIVGLCNVPINARYQMAEFFDTDVKDVYLEYVGLNHMDFITKVYINGKDRTTEAVEHFIAKSTAVKNIKNIHWSDAALRSLNAIPNDYLRYYWKRQPMLEDELNDYRQGHTRGEVVREVERSLFEMYKDPSLDEKPQELAKRGGARYSEAACRLISSLYNNTGDIQTVNVPNQGSIGFLDPSEVCEVNCVITSHGPVPLCAERIPQAIKGIIQTLKSVEHTVIDAAVSGDRDMMTLAMTINPLVADDVSGGELLEEMLLANQRYLPAFFQE